MHEPKRVAVKLYNTKKELLGLTTTIFTFAKCVTSLIILPISLHVDLYSVVKYGILSSPEVVDIK